jgi:cell wall-associated NlpC family hydrolase
MGNHRLSTWLVIGSIGLAATGCTGGLRSQRDDLAVTEYQTERGWLPRKRRSRTRDYERPRKRPGYLNGSDAEPLPDSEWRRNGPAEDTGEPRTSGRTTASAAAPASRRASKVIREAQRYKGTKYQWGGTSKRGIDCSGLMQVSFRKGGVDLPRVSRDQYKAGEPIKRKDVRPGDMIFFSYKRGKRITHAGLVVEVLANGDIKFIHASSSAGVIESTLSEDYWKKRYTAACRVLD